MVFVNLLVNRYTWTESIMKNCRSTFLNTRDSMAIFGVNTQYPGYQIKTADGVYSITTRSLPPLVFSNTVFHSLNVNFSGYNEQSIFYSLVHHSTLESDYKPNLRTTGIPMTGMTEYEVK